jgi:hypothetical protein
MQIPKLIEKDILNVEKTVEYDDYSDILNDKPSKTDITLSFDLSKTMDGIFKENQMLEDKFGFLNDLFEKAQESFRREGITLFDRALFFDINFELKNGEDLKTKVNSVMSTCNNAVEKVIDDTFGKNLQIFIKEKNDEAQHELSIDYLNAVSTIFHKNIRTTKGCTDEDIGLLLNSTSFPNSFDMDKELEFSPNKHVDIKIQRANSYDREIRLNRDKYDRVLNSKFVDSFDFIQKNNAESVRLKANKEGVDLITKTFHNAREEFKATPMIKRTETDLKDASFVGHANDGKGNHADVWKSKSTGEIQVLTGINTYFSLDLLEVDNKKLSIACQKVFNEFENKNTKVKKVKIR